jgi:signal transduction histidine kinase
MHQSGIEVAFESPPNPLPVEASKTQLQQAALNLILNAQQAMPGGGRLELSLQEEVIHGQKVASARFIDTGPGIPEELRHRIFDSFLSNRSGGSGLGLSIVRRILEGHRGGVELLQTSPSGTTIRFWLPLRRQ